MPWGKQSSWQYEPDQWLKWDCQSVLPADILIAYMVSIFRLEVNLLQIKIYHFRNLHMFRSASVSPKCFAVQALSSVCV